MSLGHYQYLALSISDSSDLFIRTDIDIQSFVNVGEHYEAANKADLKAKIRESPDDLETIERVGPTRAALLREWAGVDVGSGGGE